MRSKSRKKRGTLERRIERSIERPQALVRTGNNGSHPKSTARPTTSRKSAYRRAVESRDSGHGTDPRTINRRNRPTPMPRRRPPRDSMLGKVLGSYELLDLLGEGGMGRVYLAQHRMIGRRVALKLLRPEYSAKRDAVHRFFQEARAVNAIGHENIVDITDYVELDSGETFFIMELLIGDTLADLLRASDRPIPLHRAMQIALQVCDALIAAHSKSIVHRDLKPDNIFIVDKDDKDFVKLLDFGVAKLFGDTSNSYETQVGSVIGTPAYMSPEQASGNTCRSSE